MLAAVGAMAATGVRLPCHFSKIQLLYPRKISPSANQNLPYGFWKMEDNRAIANSSSCGRGISQMSARINDRQMRSAISPAKSWRGLSSLQGFGLRSGNATAVQTGEGVRTVLQAVKGDSSSTEDADQAGKDDLTTTAASVGIFILWAGFAAYAFTLAPNLTPYRDQYFLEKLVGLRSDDGFEMNHVLLALWNLMGVWPLLYAMLLIPTGRSSKGSPPIWPFSTASMFVGAFALLPYFALWRGDGPPPLPSAEERNNRALKVLDSKVTAVVAFVGAFVLLGYAALAGVEGWAEFMDFFRGSRLVHITSLDFCILSAMAPFWLYNDMSVRKWEGRDTWWAVLAALPMIGPAVYLILRPGLPDPDSEP